MAIKVKADGEWVEVDVWRKFNDRKKERLRIKLTCSSKSSLSPTGGNGSSVAMVALWLLVL